MAEPQPRLIPARWLVVRVPPAHPEFGPLRGYLAAFWQTGDEVWRYDEPAPPGVNAGELGVAIVRAGQPIHAVMLGVH